MPDLLDEGLRAQAVHAFVVDDVLNELGLRRVATDSALFHLGSEESPFGRYRPPRLYDHWRPVCRPMMRRLRLGHVVEPRGLCALPAAVAARTRRAAAAERVADAPVPATDAAWFAEHG